MINFAPPPIQPPGGIVDPNEIARREAIARALQEQASGMQDIQSPWQGVNQVAQAVVGGLGSQRAAQEKQANQQALIEAISGTADGTPLTQDKLAMVMALNPELGMGMMQDQQGRAQAEGEKKRAAEALSAMGLTEQADAVMSGVLSLDDASNMLMKSWETPKAPDMPADVDTYNWYAQGEQDAGRQPMSFLEFQQAQKGGGFSVTMPDGTVVQQGGSPKLTEGQSKDAFYFIRGAGANDNLTANEASLTSLGDTMANGVPLIGNYFTSDGFKNANRDGKEFLAAVLRKDSGGAITPDEWSYYGPMYLPAPGDNPDQLARKREARNRAMEALKAVSGPAKGVIDEYLMQHPPAATPPSGGGTPGAPPQPGQPVPEEVTAVNPATGERIKLINGQWVPF